MSLAEFLQVAFTLLIVGMSLDYWLAKVWNNMIGRAIVALLFAFLFAVFAGKVEL